MDPLVTAEPNDKPRRQVILIVEDAIFYDLGSISGAAKREFLEWLEQRPHLPVLLVEGLNQGGSPAPMPTGARMSKPYAMSDVEQHLHALLTRQRKEPPNG